MMTGLFGRCNSTLYSNRYGVLTAWIVIGFGDALDCRLAAQSLNLKHLMQALIALILAIVTIHCSGQGTIVFANAGPGLNAPVFDAAGTRISGPSSFVADFFWSSDTGATMDQLVAAGFNQGFLSVNANGGGYFNSGLKTLPSPGGVTILGQVRVWDTDFGATYAQARDNGGQFGFSNMFTVTPDTPPGGGI
jgi:hypothetical protein